MSRTVRNSWFRVVDCQVCGYKGESLMSDKDILSILTFTLEGEVYHFDACPKCGVVQRVTETEVI